MKKMTIPRKYLRDDFADFVLNINDLGRDFMPIDGGGSIAEYACHFELLDPDGISLKGLLRLLSSRGCITVFRKENRVRLHHEELTSFFYQLKNTLQILRSSRKKLKRIFTR